MIELEIRALIGDKYAQALCTEKGIALACPFCGNEPIIEDNRVFCGVCGLAYEELDAGMSLRSWNTRQAVQIRPCRECAHIRYNEENDPYCSYKNGLGDPYEWDFCSYFEPKRSEENE